VNNGGRQPALLHLLLAGADPTTPVPEPASLVILGSALLAAG
jgi:hypothetical protein